MKIALFVHCFFPSICYGTETYTLRIAQNVVRICAGKWSWKGRIVRGNSWKPI